jgi:hypothetical protein
MTGDEKSWSGGTILNRSGVELVVIDRKRPAEIPKGVAVAATMTLWMNTITGERLDRDALEDLRIKAHWAYEKNSHIFEDEYEALTALGAVPMSRLRDGLLEIA